MYWRPIGSRTWAFQRTHYWTPKIQDGWDPPSWKSTWRHFLLLRVWSDLDKISQTGAEWHVDCGDVVISKPDVNFQYGGRLGEFRDMSSQSHMPRCRVLPPREFNVIIPELCVTLQDAATANSTTCHPRATYHIAGCCHLVNSLSWFHRHMPHCRV